MKSTAIRSVSVFGVGLGLAASLGQGDTRLPVTPVQPPMLYLPVPKQRALSLPRTVVPHAPSLNAPGNVMPHSYMVYGLRTGPGGMAFTDRNGTVILVPSDVQIHMGPFMTSPTVPQVLPPKFTPPNLTPPLFTLPELTPKK